MDDEQQAWSEVVGTVAEVLDARLDGTLPPIDTPLVAAAELVVYLAANHFTNRDELLNWILKLSEIDLDQAISTPLPKRK